MLASTEHDLTVSFITTQLKWQEESDVLLHPTTENGLKKPSLLRLSKLTTIDKDLVIGRLGSLTKDELAIVNSSLIKLFKLRP